LFASEQSDKLCNCLKEGKKSGDRSKMNQCLVLQEELVKDMKEDSPEYRNYKEGMRVCEAEMARASLPNPDGTIEQKVADVCGCAEGSKGERGGRMKCSMMQHNYSKTFSDGSEEKKSFLNQTNSCL